MQFTDAVSVGKQQLMCHFDDAFSEVKTIGVALSEDLVFSDSVGITKSVTQSISETLVLDDALAEVRQFSWH